MTRTILYIDDDPEALSVLKIGLEDRGYAVVTAPGAKEALALLATERPALIITDLRMSPVNGFDLYQTLRKDPAHAGTPFIFLTAVEDEFAEAYGRKLDVVAYLKKPVDLDRLQELLERRLGPAH